MMHPLRTVNLKGSKNLSHDSLWFICYMALLGVERHSEESDAWLRMVVFQQREVDVCMQHR